MSTCDKVEVSLKNITKEEEMKKKIQIVQKQNIKTDTYYEKY